MSDREPTDKEPFARESPTSDSALAPSRLASKPPGASTQKKRSSGAPNETEAEVLTRSAHPPTSTFRSPIEGGQDVVLLDKANAPRSSHPPKPSSAAQSPHEAEPPHAAMARESRRTSQAAERDRPRPTIETRQLPTDPPMVGTSYGAAARLESSKKAAPPKYSSAPPPAAQLAIPPAPNLPTERRIPSPAPVPQELALPSEPPAAMHSVAPSSVAPSSVAPATTSTPPPEPRGRIPMLLVGLTAGAVIAIGATWVVLTNRGAHEDGGGVQNGLDTRESSSADGPPTVEVLRATAIAGEQSAPMPAEPTASDSDLGPVPEAIDNLAPLQRRQIAQDLRIRGRSLYRKEEYLRAEAVWRLALQHDPESGVAAEGLAKTLSGQRRYEDARRWARRAVELDPREPRHHEVLGDMLFQAGDLAGAIAEYRAGLQASPDDTRLRRRLTRARNR